MYSTFDIILFFLINNHRLFIYHRLADYFRGLIIFKRLQMKYWNKGNNLQVFIFLFALVMKMSYFSITKTYLWHREEAVLTSFLQMLFVQHSNFKGLYVLSSKLLEIYWNQLFFLNDESIMNIGVLRHEFDLNSEFYLLKSLLCFILLTPFLKHKSKL